jgi:hypothetical protein
MKKAAWSGFITLRLSGSAHKNNKISAQTITRIIRLPMKRFVVISTGASAESV